MKKREKENSVEASGLVSLVYSLSKFVRLIGQIETGIVDLFVMLCVRT